ncbi:MAG TPA: hypothetical protein VFU05_13630 [Cyclobacteriaceae bacterium]|nr:hypothetical protein [Cyclobacteriaceae bacterium]
MSEDPERAEYNKLRRSLESGENSNRPQGSLYSWQKRKIADACEYMRTKPVHKPIIFVATSPGFTDLASERSLIKSFTHNLRNGYDCKNYVWVREFTGAGYPHFHFVADMPHFDVVRLSQYWSGLFDSDSRNSIRLGSAPDRHGRRNYYLTGKRHAWYLSKYLSKSIGKEERGALVGRSFRTFAVSRELTNLSAPIEFESKMARVTTRQILTANGSYQPFHEDKRIWQNCVSTMTEEEVFKKWKWQYTGFANTHKGFPKSWKLKKRQDAHPG